MRLVGSKVPRVEDRRVLTGGGTYIDDIRLPRMLHAAFLRSPVAHAEISAVDATDARAAPGVHAVFTGQDIAALTNPIPVAMTGGSGPEFHALATDRVRFAGDLVALVVADSRQQAEDAAELVDVSYEPLPAVASCEEALGAGAPVLFPEIEGNVVVAESTSIGDVDAVFGGADHVVELTITQQRVSPAPMETRGALAAFDPSSGALTFHCNSQSPHSLRIALGATLGFSTDRIRVIVPDVGGAFGQKSNFGREDFAVAAAARQLGRPIKWTEDRYENLMAGGHAREESLEIAVAVKGDGTLLGLRAHLLLDQGAYPGVPFPASIVTGLVQPMLPGPYRWRAYEFRRTIVATNKCTYLAYRGPWAIETFARERIIDEVARRLSLDPTDVRRRNLATGAADDRMVSGMSLAHVSSLASLERAVELIDYPRLRAEQETARATGRHVGIGISTFIEAAPGPPEMRAANSVANEGATVRLESDGHLLVYTSQVPQGQSHETTLAQIAADEMGVPFDHVTVLHGDTRDTPFKFIGTGGSMAATWASGAVRVSTRKLKEKVLAIASDLLEIGVADLDIEDGSVVPRGAPARAMPLAQIAMQAYASPDTLPPGVDKVLEAKERFTGEGITGSGWSGGTHVCVAELDLETGRVTILRYLVVEDCGRVINPAIVEGQVRGGVAQGIGEVLYERAAYDDDGNFLAGTFMDYLIPTAAEIPPIEIDHLETDPDGEFGFRGVGEGGTIAAPAAVVNAIADALSPTGVVVCEQYLPPARILELAGVISVE